MLQSELVKMYDRQDAVAGIEVKLCTAGQAAAGTMTVHIREALLQPFHQVTVVKGGQVIIGQHPVREPARDDSSVR